MAGAQLVPLFDATPHAADAALPVPTLALARYRVSFRARERIELPDFAGSTWRGALGHALKRTVCVTRERDCRTCVLLRACAYPYLFETPPAPDATKMRRYPAAPHPFVLDAERGGARDVAPGEIVDIGLVLVGHANRSLGYLVHALGRAAGGGVGHGRGRLDLEAVLQERAPGEGDWQPILAGGALSPRAPASPVIPPPPRRARIVLETPLRIQRDGRIVGTDTLDFGDLFRALLRRVSMLTAFHTDTPLETDFARLARDCDGVRTTARGLGWRERTRWSTRQQARMTLGGVVGTLDVEGDLAPFWPYLWLGSLVHAGKAATMGLGRFRIETPA